MEEQESNELHRLVDGLPTSLLAIEGGTCAAIALMKRTAGLTRDRRRSLHDEVWVSPGALYAVPTDAPKGDRGLLTHYLSAICRFVHFWKTVDTLVRARGPGGPIAYALAIDLQLLKAYNTEFLSLSLDEATLERDCNAWAAIRKRVETTASQMREHRPLGIFMLWPRLVGDLRRWKELSAGERQVVGHAIFALSSVALTDWFILAALRFCPELEVELGRLVDRHRADSASNVAIERAKEAPVGRDQPCADAPASSCDAQPDESSNGNSFAALLERLDELAAELHEGPTREAVAELLALARQMEASAAVLSTREPAVVELFESRLSQLVVHMRELAAQDGFGWFRSDLVDQVEARWILAARERTRPEQLEELTADAKSAILRSEGMKASVVEGWQKVRECVQSLAALDQQLSQAKGFAEEVACKRKRTDAIRRQADLEAVQQAQQERLVDAMSPFEEPFDYSCDYVALLGHVAGQGVSLRDDTASSGGHDTADESHAKVAIDSSGPSVTAVESRQSPGGSDVEAVVAVPVDALPQQLLTSDYHEELSATVPATDERAGQSIPTSGFEPASSTPAAARADSSPFTSAAGEVCRPIWKLLEIGQPALAYHAATWIGAISPGTAVPSQDLLAAVALEGSLLLPDAGVQTEIGERLIRISRTDFAAETPRDWHTAVNLLLAAAVLRPMILAPGTGAASVADYLHQDGRYPSLYSLVQRLRSISPLLMGFRIEPTALRQARGEAALRADVQALQHEAEDWLHVQAPAYTIKFAAATNVWRQWLRPGGEIDVLVGPVAHNRVADADRVREGLAAMSNHDHVQRMIRETDRKVLKRHRGEDIHAGARDHLLRLVEESLRFPRRWLVLVELLGKRADRMREILEQVHAALREHEEAVEDELRRVPANDDWSLIRSSQAQALCAVRGMKALFDSTTELSVAEPEPAEVLGRPLLLLPDLAIDEDWNVEASPSIALGLIEHWIASPVSPETALRRRLDRGDLLGAEMLVQSGLVAEQSAQLRVERERWKQALRKEVAECRRATEVGSAYGYLLDAERGRIESRLAQSEAQLDEMRRFDVELDALKKERMCVVAARDAQAQRVRETMKGIGVPDELLSAAAEVETVLADGDIATANELVHWLAMGQAAPTNLDEESREGFNAFFPSAMQEIESWLEDRPRDAVERALRLGQNIPGVEATVMAGAQREQAAKVFTAWADMKAHQGAEQSRLEPMLTGLGFTVREVRRLEKVAGREIWMLDAAPIEDRQICPVPTYGSGAAGKYRVVCLWGRPTEEDLLQWVGDTTVSRPVLLLYFGRMTERKWRELSRMSKAKRRSFLILDETLLVYLCHAVASRLRAWFDAALPFSFSSPYDATAGLVPPEMFYGRGAELDAVLGLNGRCFIYGGRQLGKTALLKRAEQAFHVPAHGHVARWIDLRAEGIGVSREASELWNILHEKLKAMNVLDAKIQAPVPGKKQSVDAVVRATGAFLSVNPDRRVLLLLDEADRFFEQDSRSDFEETRRLKQLMDETARRFKVVFAGLHNVLRMTERPNHPLAHFGEPIEIGPLRAADEVREAVGLIRRPMAAAGFSFESRALVIRILAQTNYYPSLIQLYCSHLLRHMLRQVEGRQKPAGPRYVVTDRDIEQVYSSDALRDEIRAKFRLTLQLDPRYEVVAYAMALDLLRDRYSQADGVSWQTIRQSGAMHWWAEGFRDTSELDFRVLLDEMVGLGVLRHLGSGNYALRNPNVLLLLGTLDEIEAVLIKDREPVVEFESASFRPPLRAAPSAAVRNVFTYQQLSRLLQRTNAINVVAGTEAAGIDGVVSSLQDYLGAEAAPLILEGCTDRQAFGEALGKALAGREKDQVTTIVVPYALPWTGFWLAEAEERLRGLKSVNRFASVVFVAEPATLWRLLTDDVWANDAPTPWMSLLHWRDEFLRHWLDERQLQLDQDDRRRLGRVTAFWPALILDVAGDCRELRVLRERLDAAHNRWFSSSNEVTGWRRRFGVDVGEPAMVVEVLAQLGEPVSAGELAAVAELPAERVNASLRWAELLGMVRTEGAGLWTTDPIVKTVLLGDAV